MAEADPKTGKGPEIITAPKEAPPRFSGQIAISDKAAHKLKSLVEAEEKDPSEVGLRLGVQGGGCSGLSYFMDFDSAREDDKVFVHEGTGARVIVDSKSILHVSGSVLEYKETLMSAGFQVQNPNVKSSCGCGESFST